MQPTIDLIRTTYLSRFNEMTLEYRLHFTSRLYAWNSDPEAARLLRAIQPEVLPANHEDRLQALKDIREELVHKDYARDVNDYTRRKPFFDSYPNLLLLHNALFRIRHWLCIYGQDERTSLYEIIPKDDVEELISELRADAPAMRALSTYAINTLYLYEKLFDQKGIDPETILDLASSYDRSNPSDVQIMIYLYTHCILGETLFYYQPIASHSDTYLRMLEELDTLIEENFDTISLDNKCEFLVCSQICGYEARQKTRIEDEVARSVGAEDFIVDTHNSATNPAKQSFMMSEHRNVLFIMSQSKPVFQRQPIS
jgi:hypothetical protein